MSAFRTDGDACLGRRRAALFELGEALLSGGPVLSPGHLSLEPIHRRGWGSLYAALAHGTSDVEALRRLLALRARRARRDQTVPIFAVDVSVWPRCDAEASPERGSDYHPSRHSAGQPIVAGWAYQWIAQRSLTRDSWTVPLDVRRGQPRESAATVAVLRIQALVARVPAAASVPLFVFDAGDDPLHLAAALADTPAAILVRLRRGRCFYADPPPPSGRGRPRRHGQKFTCADPHTWPTPTAEQGERDAQ